MNESIECMAERLKQYKEHMPMEDCRHAARVMIEADLLRREQHHDPNERVLGQAMRYGVEVISECSHCHFVQNEGEYVGKECLECGKGAYEPTGKVWLNNEDTEVLDYLESLRGLPIYAHRREMSIEAQRSHMNADRAYDIAMGVDTSEGAEQ